MQELLPYQENGENKGSQMGLTKKKKILYASKLLKISFKYKV
jgi:hypothetical protein